MRNLFFLFLFFTSGILAQVKTEKFRQFAVRQDSLFIKAYEQKDIKTYDKLLNEFLGKYKKLSPDDKKYFSGYLSGAYYNFSCTYSLLDDKSLALNYLKKSIEAGYLDYWHMQEDSDLDNIRNEKEFKDLNNHLRGIADFLFILKKAGKYNVSDNRKLPVFTYQSSNDPHLIALRKAFNLDSIAGQGTDVLKILNLLHWIHNLIPHDGNHENPVVKNAMSMIKACRQEKRGLNCRGLATVLNECYLALGIKSRIVTCLPKDSLKIDYDCHVINLVYSDTLKKWLWIDPTNNAYVMDQNGELLSIEEVRERIITDKPVIVNPDANWNNQVVKNKENYLFTYMTKNLYIFECPVHSEFDMETQKENKTYEYIRLLPLDYFAQSPDKTEEKNVKKKTTWVTYKTNNPNLFWQTP